MHAVHHEWDTETIKAVSMAVRRGIRAVDARLTDGTISNDLYSYTAGLIHSLLYFNPGTMPASTARKTGRRDHDMDGDESSGGEEDSADLDMMPSFLR